VKGQGFLLNSDGAIRFWTGGVVCDIQDRMPRIRLRKDELADVVWLLIVWLGIFGIALGVGGVRRGSNSHDHIWYLQVWLTTNGNDIITVQTLKILFFQ
jgi:hypothetical protein